MKNNIAGIINGTGAALFACIGFVPDWVTLYNLEDADEARLFWNRNMMRSGDMKQGLRFVGSGGATQQTPLTSLGIEPYFGGDTMTSTNQTSVTYGEGIYLRWLHGDLRGLSTRAIVPGDAKSADINEWTLDTAGSFTGHFNSDIVASGNRIQEGSEIIIDGKRYAINAITADQGSGDDDVTLNQDAATGAVEFIGPSFDLSPVAIGDVAPAGFQLSATDVINVNDELISFEAGTWDD